MAGKKAFIAIPAKAAYDVDIASRVSSYMQTCMSLNPEVTSSVKESLDQLNKLRREAFIHDECGKTVSSIERMHKYYDSFSSLDEKIQIKDGECPIPFRWKAAFDKGGLFSGKRDLTFNYGGYEKACTLFNIAAYQSKFVAATEFINDEDLRTAVRFFQSSANIFNLLKDEVMHFIPDEIPRDMQPQLLNALAQLMITQANEIMYIKGVKDGNSPASLKSIAAQLSDSYGQVYKLLSYDQAKGIVDKSWYSIIQGKELAFLAYASKHQAEFLESGNTLDAIEEKLGRAKEILEIFEKAAEVNPKMYEEERQTAKRNWEKAEKDNSLIYHVRIPNRTDLPQIQRKSLLNLGTAKFPMSKDFSDIFVDLVSVHVSKAVNAFHGQMKDRVHAFLTELRTSITATKAGLASINMPALIEDETKHERIPASIAKKSDDIRAKGGFHMIESREQIVAQSSKETLDLINSIRSKLDNEESTDSALRGHYGARWSPVASSQLTIKFKQDIGKYMGIYKTATAADEKVKSKIRLCERDVAIMTGPRDGLVARIPPITSSGSEQTQAVEKLRELMAVMDRELDSADQLEKKLGDFKYDPTNEFLEQLKKEGSLEDQKVASFCGTKLEGLLGDVYQQILANKGQRTDIIEEMKVWHQRFSAGSTVDDERSKALQQLAAAYDAFLECDGNLQEGIKFYNDLKVILTRLQQQIDDYTFARQTEIEDLVSVMESGKKATDVISSIVEAYKKKNGGALGSVPRPPPPRPPPPSQPQSQPNPTQFNQMSISDPNPSAPAIPPRNAPPPPPQHQPQYQPNVQTPYQWGYPPQQPMYGQQPGYGQPMPQLPYYGAFQNEAQPGYATAPYHAPYPMQYPPSHPSMPYPQYPPQNPQQQAPNPNPSNNPFA